MIFYLIKLNLDVSYYEDEKAPQSGCWEECQREKEIKDFYSVKGSSLNIGKENSFNACPIPEFLNPDNKLYKELWGSHCNKIYEGYLGNEAATRNSVYGKFGLLVLPNHQNQSFVAKYMNIEAGLYALGDNPDTEKIKEFVSNLNDPNSNATRLNASNSVSDLAVDKLLEFLKMKNDPVLTIYILNEFPAFELVTENSISLLLQILKDQWISIKTFVLNNISKSKNPLGSYALIAKESDDLKEEFLKIMFEFVIAMDPKEYFECSCLKDSMINEITKNNTH